MQSSPPIVAIAVERWRAAADDDASDPDEHANIICDATHERTPSRSLRHRVRMVSSG